MLACSLSSTFFAFSREALNEKRGGLKKNLDLLSIPQSGGKMSKRLGGIIGCSWHLKGFLATRWLVSGLNFIKIFKWVDLAVQIKLHLHEGFVALPNDNCIGPTASVGFAHLHHQSTAMLRHQRQQTRASLSIHRLPNNVSFSRGIISYHKK